jgi:hypothetical protein
VRRFEHNLPVLLLMLFVASSLQAHQFHCVDTLLDEYAYANNQQLRVYMNAATAVDDGVDSHFPFDNNPGAEMGVRARMAVSSSSKAC